jgi:hypothetical protein
MILSSFGARLMIVKFRYFEIHVFVLESLHDEGWRALFSGSCMIEGS